MVNLHYLLLKVKKINESHIKTMNKYKVIKENEKAENAKTIDYMRAIATSKTIGVENIKCNKLKKHSKFLKYSTNLVLNKDSSTEVSALYLGSSLGMPKIKAFSSI